MQLAGGAHVSPLVVGVLGGLTSHLLFVAPPLLVLLLLLAAPALLRRGGVSWLRLRCGRRDDLRGISLGGGTTDGRDAILGCAGLFLLQVGLLEPRQLPRAADLVQRGVDLDADALILVPTPPVLKVSEGYTQYSLDAGGKWLLGLYHPRTSLWQSRPQ
jgi:hypothetical protein